MEFNGSRFHIRLLKLDDAEEVARLGAKVFTEREPLNIHLKHTEDYFYSSSSKYWVEECVKENLSFVCLDTSLSEERQIVAFRLSQTLKPSNNVNIETSDCFNDKEALRCLFTDFKNAWFQKHSQCSNSINGLKCLYFVSLGVKSGYENMGIASKLLEHSLNHAKAMGYNYVFVIATSAGTQHLFEKKYNFKEVISKDYERIEFKGNYFLKGIKRPPKVVGYEFDLNNWISK